MCAAGDIRLRREVIDIYDGDFVALVHEGADQIAAHHTAANTSDFGHIRILSFAIL